MNRSIRLFCAVTLLAAAAGCGTGNGDGSGIGRADTVLLYAGKTSAVSLVLPEDVTDDSLVAGEPASSGLVFSIRGRTVSMSAMLVPSVGTTAADRLEYLSTSTGDSVYLRTEPSLGDIPGFTAVLYDRDGISVAERTWGVGAGELLILEAHMEGETPGILLELTGMVFRNASGVLLEEDPRGVRLSDRSRTVIVEEVNADVAPPPVVLHALTISVDPVGRVTEVTDTMTVDFGNTLSDSVLPVILPSGAVDMEFTALRGGLQTSGGFAYCAADSMRVFQGLFTGSWDGFMSGSADSITGGGLQIRPTCSFQCGMWFYPGTDIPADYRLELIVPGTGYSVYVPLPETSRSITDSTLTVSFTSGAGGIRGPLAWAAGRFTTGWVAGGRSAFMSYEADSLAQRSMELADLLATSVWNSLGFEGARLDFFVVRSLDVPVFLTGPGCLLVSSDVLLSLEGYPEWEDSLAAGLPVRAAAIAAGAAGAFLTESTWLDPSLRSVLSSWAVYRFVSDNGQSGALLLEAFMKYYLYQARVTGGTEYAIADPLLLSSPLSGPVLTGKGPVVIEFLHREIPAFGNALRRALGNLRHSGDSFGRIFSQMNLSQTGPYGELYNRWLYGPGVPVIRVTWSDSSGILDIQVEQLQPGQDFPLGSVMDTVTAFTPAGPQEVVMSHGPVVGSYTGTHYATGGVTGIDLDPDRVLPADIVYIHAGGP